MSNVLITVIKCCWGATLVDMFVVGRNYVWGTTSPTEIVGSWVACGEIWGTFRESQGELALLEVVEFENLKGHFLNQLFFSWDGGSKQNSSCS